VKGEHDVRGEGPADEETVCGPDGEPVLLRLVVVEDEGSFVGYAEGLSGAVVGQGQTFGECVQDLRSAVNCHLETFGMEGLAGGPLPPSGTRLGAMSTEVSVLRGPSGMRIQDTFMTLAGSISPEDADEMIRAIEEDCERIWPEDWECSLEEPLEAG